MNHGIFSPLFNPAFTSDPSLERMEKESPEDVDRHLNHGMMGDRLLVQRFIDEWPAASRWLRDEIRERTRRRLAWNLEKFEGRALTWIGKVVDATHKAQLDRRAAAKRLGNNEYGRPAVHIIGKYANPFFQAVGKLRTRMER